MLSRRSVIASVLFASVAVSTVAWGTQELQYTSQAFAAALQAGKPVLVVIHAKWCPTCKAQMPILSELIAQPKFGQLTVLKVDFDTQKSAVRKFGAQLQSTLIVFKGATEVGRSVGDTNRETIAALLDRAL